MGGQFADSEELGRCFDATRLAAGYLNVTSCFLGAALAIGAVRSPGQSLGHPIGTFAWVVIAVSWVGVIAGYIDLEFAKLEPYLNPNYDPHSKGKPPAPTTRYIPSGGAFFGLNKTDGELQALWDEEVQG
ncbi:UNVERIFIED_CONTAM: hypothetical protein HDU68_000817 [Siphonaria sp. JEL0065]|nr:hypothetical protein HDU68_000815 [Siphonaria sp. JEL0065]KAJ3013223.1 hypothetical protein HDU68_000817 [Siphonaria sp. JEL0065]